MWRKRFINDGQTHLRSINQNNPGISQQILADDDDDDDDVSSEEEAQSPPLKPTRYSLLYQSSSQRLEDCLSVCVCVCLCRYGRMPKPTKLLNYPSKEDTHLPASSSSCSEATSAPTTGPSAPRPRSKCPAKRRGKAPSVPEPKRPKLITLRASPSEYSDDDEDGSQEWAGPGQQQQHLGCTSSSDGAAAFVPASLCSLHPVSVEVEETMEEVQVLLFLPTRIQDVHSFYFLHVTSFSFWFSLFVHAFTFHFPTLHSAPSSISLPVCPMCWASPKMLCALT